MPLECVLLLAQIAKTYVTEQPLASKCVQNFQSSRKRADASPTPSNKISPRIPTLLFGAKCLAHEVENAITARLELVD
jgi:hypothetical protein